MLSMCQDVTYVLRDNIRIQGKINHSNPEPKIPKILSSRTNHLAPQSWKEITYSRRKTSLSTNRHPSKERVSLSRRAKGNTKPLSPIGKLTGIGIYV